MPRLVGEVIVVLAVQPNQHTSNEYYFEEFVYVETTILENNNPKSVFDCLPQQNVSSGTVVKPALTVITH